MNKRRDRGKGKTSKFFGRFVLIHPIVSILPFLSLPPIPGIYEYEVYCTIVVLYLVVLTPQCHIAGSSIPPPSPHYVRFVPCIFYREKTFSALSSLADWRRTVGSVDVVNGWPLQAWKYI